MLTLHAEGAETAAGRVALWANGMMPAGGAGGGRLTAGDAPPEVFEAAVSAATCQEEVDERSFRLRGGWALSLSFKIWSLRFYTCRGGRKDGAKTAALGQPGVNHVVYLGGGRRARRAGLPSIVLSFGGHYIF